MKKTLSVLSVSLAGVLFLTLFSCTRTVTPPSLASQITGKWVIKTAIGNYTVNGSNRKDTTAFTSNDYFEFNADGTLFISESGSEYQGNWQITGNKLIITNTHYMEYPGGFDLPILTANDLQLYYTETKTVPDSYLEQKLNLTR